MNLYEAVSSINSTLSDYVLLVLLSGIGIFFTVRTRFVQIRCFKEGWKNAFSSFSFHGGSKGGFSSFQALSTAVAAQVGTGNIVGAAGAILTGGPGAIFWMWVIAFFGMATSYAEAVLAQETREKDHNGTVRGGPVFYINRAFPNFFGKFLAVFFAFSMVLSLGFMGTMVQANSIGEACQHAFNIPAWFIGIGISVIAAFIFLGGISRIASVTEKIVPLMAVFYMAGCMVILICRIQYIPETFAVIFRYAFMPEALLGGSFGSALKIAVTQGVKRGLFSNEAGMGSTPHAHAIAEVKSPHIQGTVAMIGVFIDTAVVLTMTALVVISTIYTGNGPLAGAGENNYSELIAAAGLTKTNLVSEAISSVSGNIFGNIFVAICLLFFAFSTILSWNYFGRINSVYLFGKKSVPIYSIIAVAFIFTGTVLKNDLVWELQDLFNQLLVLPNVIAIAALSGAVAAAAGKKY